MKILVLQLARLGDIYQSWPALRALRRAHPDAQIDLLVRPKFAGAVEGLDAISNCIHWNTIEVIKPLLLNLPDIKSSLRLIDQFILSLKKQNYDQIINLSFSPVSSYLVHALQTSKTEVHGYNRHQDGFFDISGEISTYFYAQVGIGRFNRFHLTDLIAGVMGVELTPEDWHPPVIDEKKFEFPEEYIVLHVGSSELQKSLPAYRWSRILNYFYEQCPNQTVFLIGSKDEIPTSELIQKNCHDVNMINLVGKTSVKDLFSVLIKSRLLIGCDSAPMHMAAFTKTPCLNLSLGAVNFWETGPRSTRSFILRAPTAEQIVSEHVSQSMKEILEGRDPVGLIKYIPESPCFLLLQSLTECPPA